MTETLIAIFGILAVIEVFNYIINHYKKDCIPLGVTHGLAQEHTQHD